MSVDREPVASDRAARIEGDKALAAAVEALRAERDRKPWWGRMLTRLFGA